jgi:hypothetical protein
MKAVEVAKVPRILLRNLFLVFARLGHLVVEESGHDGVDDGENDEQEG